MLLDLRAPSAFSIPILSPLTYRFSLRLLPESCCSSANSVITFMLYLLIKLSRQFSLPDPAECPALGLYLNPFCFSMNIFLLIFPCFVTGIWIRKRLLINYSFLMESTHECRGFLCSYTQLHSWMSGLPSCGPSRRPLLLFIIGLLMKHSMGIWRRSFWGWEGVELYVSPNK